MTHSEKTGWIGYWSPGIGDPTMIGWVTVALYAAAAVMCWYAARACSRTQPEKPVPRHEVTLWRFLSIALWFLCINKQLDLQTAFTEFARLLAHRDGWYAERGAYQRMFITGLLLGCTFGTALLLFITRRMSLPIKLAMTGLCVLGVFVLTRASSFHHVDLLLGSRVIGLKWNWILEISGIGIIAFAALRKLKLDN